VTHPTWAKAGLTCISSAFVRYSSTVPAENSLLSYES
jgi:hypothetical protein